MTNSGGVSIGCTFVIEALDPLLDIFFDDFFDDFEDFFDIKLFDEDLLDFLFVVLFGFIVEPWASE